MASPFDNDQGAFLAIVNTEGQYSLWPAFADIPAGWTAAYGKDTRGACLGFIEQNWTDLRPASLVEDMARREGAAVEVSVS